MLIVMFIVRVFLRHSYKKSGNMRRTLTLKTKHLFGRDAWQLNSATRKEIR